MKLIRHLSTASKVASKRIQGNARNASESATGMMQKATTNSAFEPFPVNLTRNQKPKTRASTAEAPSVVQKPAAVELKTLQRSKPISSWVSRNHQLALETRNDRLLARDFIHDSLYNPDYGYFSKRATIFSPPENIQFNQLKSTNDFMEHIAQLYSQYDEVEEDGALQVWHTPTELFKPYYGFAIAEYILSEHLKRNSGKPLIIYEMGAGNGTMMRNIMQYVQKKRPDLFSSMKYNIIEISRQLTERQEWTNMSQLSRQAQLYQKQVQIINKSIFDWDEYVEDDCFFIALEVIDNFAHDAIRYQLDTSSMNPVQTFVVTEKESKQMKEEFEPVHDPLIKRYLDLRSRTSYQSPILPTEWRRSIRQHLPFAPNLSEREFLPTMQLCFLEKLFEKFPRHRLILSDFDTLPTDIKGVDAPVVQTRQRFSMIPCSTYLVTRGWFDIFFPTNFELMGDIYTLLNQQFNHAPTHSPAITPSPTILTHAKFIEQYGDLGATRTRNGENPMMQHYSNVKFFLT